MTFRLTALVGSVAASLVLLAAPAAWGQGRDGLQMYTVQGPAGEVADGHPRRRARRRGADAHRGSRPMRCSRASQRREAQAASGVERRSSRATRRARRSAEQAARHGGRAASTSTGPGTSRAASATSSTAWPAGTPSCVKLEVLGHTHQGRELIATEAHAGRPRRCATGPGPPVLYSSNQHAREWISLEVNRRTLHHFIEQLAGERQGRSRRLLKRTELWFVISANPDGYQYTLRHRAPVAQEPARQQRRRADHRRRRRRSQPQLRRALGLRQRGLVAGPGGRDLSRSERRPRSRRPQFDAGADRPHQAEVPVEPALVRRVAPLSAGLAGRDARRGQPDLRGTGGTDDAGTGGHRIPGFNPGQSADTLYVTNVSRPTTRTSTPARSLSHPSSAREAGSGFVFPTTSALIQAEFDAVAFDLGLARSAAHPANPASPVGIDVQPFYLDPDDIDPQNGQTSLSTSSSPFLRRSAGGARARRRAASATSP